LIDALLIVQEIRTRYAWEK